MAFPIWVKGYATWLLHEDATMKSLVDQMKKCKTVDDCISVATTDAYDEDEQASGWLTCYCVLHPVAQGFAPGGTESPFWFHSGGIDLS